jgi:hypothetical protein
MTHDSDGHGIHRYLDGEGPPPPDPAEREAADRYRAAMSAYAAGLRAPGTEVDEAVLAAIRQRQPRAGSQAWWRWFVEPRQLAVRPALAVAALVAVLAVGAMLAALIPAPQRPMAETALAATSDRTVLVRFELVAPEARSVVLAGSFNGWDDSTTAFSRSVEAGVWTVTVALPPGEYQYLFVVDGQRWIPDPAAHAQVEDEFGQRNSLLVVGPRGVVRS